MGDSLQWHEQEPNSHVLVNNKYKSSKTAAMRFDRVSSLAKQNFITYTINGYTIHAKKQLNTVSELREKMVGNRDWPSSVNINLCVCLPMWAHTNAPDLFVLLERVSVNNCSRIVVLCCGNTMRTRSSARRMMDGMEQEKSIHITLFPSDGDGKYDYRSSKRTT